MAVAALPWVISGIGALAGLFGNKKQVQTQEGSSTSNSLTSNASTSNTYGTSGGNSTSTSVANLSPEAQALLTQVTDKYSKFSSEDPDLKGYQASQTSDINRDANIQSQLAAERNAGRGVSGAALDTSQANIDAQRFAATTKLKQSIPMLKNDLSMKMLSLGKDIFSSIPVGQTVTGSNSGWNSSQTAQTGTSQTIGNTTSKGNVTTPSNMVGGALAGGGAALATLYGQGAFKK